MFAEAGLLPGGLSGRVIKAKLQAGGFSLDEVARHSDEFLAQRRANGRSVLGPDAYRFEQASFAFLPVPQSFASVLLQAEKAMVMVSGGLVEVLRLGCLAGMVYSASERLRTEGQRRELAALRALQAYLNACALLHFQQPGPLPEIAWKLPPKLQHHAEVILETALMFILLHELGHVAFRRNQPTLPEDGLVWEFAVPESLDARKEEEFYADQYALRAVPPGFALHLAHAATGFLLLHNYLESTQASRPETHPLPVNRLARLYAQTQGLFCAEVVGHLALATAISNGTQAWQQPAAGLVDLPVFTQRWQQRRWQQALDILFRLDQTA